MPTRFASVAAVAAVLAVSACGSLQGSTSAQQAADGSAQTSDVRGGGSELRIDAPAVGDHGEPGLPSASGASIDDVLRLGAVATWVDAPDALAISLPASQDCSPIAGQPTVVSPSRISVTFAAEAACPAPDAARTYTVQLPADVDARAGIEVVVEGLQHRFTLTLPAN
ncbi:hypothetical protein [Agrococcus sp. ProA11]|uniref:hypothetical protein n=1 Tax=Agrococcus chionoecetis TaxID=3153752 RepID=UPI003260AE80